MESAPARRPPWFGWVVWGALAVLTPLVIAALVWTAMPIRLAQWILTQSPSFPWAYRVSERADFLTLDMSSYIETQRGVDEVMPFIAERLALPGRQASFASALLFMLCKDARSYCRTIEPKPDDRQHLVDALLPLLDSPDQDERERALACLLYLNPPEHRAHLLTKFAGLPVPSRKFLLWSVNVIDDARLADLLLTWLEHHPMPELMVPLVRQSNPGVRPVLLNILRTPGHPMAASCLRGMYEASCTDSELLEEAAKLCSSTHVEVEFNAQVVIKHTRPGLATAVALRCDPAKANLHQVLEFMLTEQSDHLSDEQRDRWKTAPPLPAHNSSP